MFYDGIEDPSERKGGGGIRLDNNAVQGSLLQGRFRTRGCLRGFLTTFPLLLHFLRNRPMVLRYVLLLATLLVHIVMLTNVLSYSRVTTLIPPRTTPMLQLLLAIIA